ncbi:hypothetical protein J2128_002144 [Methanomicrobium sp. W14]|uniref:hypothetical protein n=1 Tax=Methanomicrobium sp. W14 TaxID=2817839 RepID=UPI001FD8D67B|nr:hypothetical protein [Methanomicrobium sp. W14]MBP2134178.1 hypothetical protein [Methanomicrobium sp. W14]
MKTGTETATARLTAAKDGILTADAEEFEKNNKISLYTVSITYDSGRKIAI